MLAQATALLALGLAGCTSNGDVKASSLPLKAADGVDPLVKDFIEICSEAMTNLEGAGKTAEARGWTKSVHRSEDTGLFRGVSYTKEPLASGPDANPLATPSHAPTDLHITETSFPDVRTTSCLIVGGEFDASLEQIGQTPGLAGEVSSTSKDGAPRKLGGWSFVGRNGDPVTISAFMALTNTVQMTMATQHRVATKH